jgi:hypothetical protein
LIGLALTLTPVTDDWLPDAALLQRAESAFHQGKESRTNPSEARFHFACAAAAYETLRRRGFESAALFRDQGNAYFLAGYLPHAIQAYRRGLRLAPGDRPLQSNLALARAHVDQPQAGSVEWLPWLPRFAPFWLWTGLIGFFGLACLSFTRWWTVRRNWLLKMGGVAALGMLVLSGAAGVAEADRCLDLAHPVVVIATDHVMLHKGNGFRYPHVDELPLNQGVEARLLYSRGDWLQVELADGKVGWIPGADGLLDKPAPPGRQTSRRAKYPMPTKATATEPSADQLMSRANI